MSDSQDRGVTALATLDPHALLDKAVDQGAGIETLERLLELAKDIRAEQAKAAFNSAMAEFQRRCPPIKKTEEGDTGRYKYKYAPLEQILDTIKELAGELGLMFTFKTKPTQDSVVTNCIVAHELGHSTESGWVEIPLDPSSKVNKAQQVGIAKSYARRYALLDALGIAPEEDTDAAGLGNGGSSNSKPVKQPRATNGNGGDKDKPGVVKARVIEITKKTGENERGKWTLFQIHAEQEDGTKVQFGTFSDTVADFASSFVGKDKIVGLAYDITKRGNRNLTEVIVDDPEPETSPVEAEIVDEVPAEAKKTPAKTKKGKGGKQGSLV